MIRGTSETGGELLSDVGLAVSRPMTMDAARAIKSDLHHHWEWLTLRSFFNINLLDFNETKYARPLQGFTVDEAEETIRAQVASLESPRTVRVSDIGFVNGFGRVQGQQAIVANLAYASEDMMLAERGQVTGALESLAPNASTDSFGWRVKKRPAFVMGSLAVGAPESLKEEIEGVMLHHLSGQAPIGRADILHGKSDWRH